MSTRDIAFGLGKSGEKAYVVGPVPDKETNVAQSLLDKQRNLASKPIDPAVGSSPKQDEDRAHVVYNRIHGTGALTPGSLASVLEAGIKKKSADMETGPGKTGGDGN
ncbi:uncharacterized protein HRG_05126 [Hirsutella rhossiliensis]|uniref:Uncharacterized protein n=1 Tax=Hirsutella rhossiliensis TaxID=111463 RepID=A0A9P8SIY1_9HYPO|nr:uncharacterized protein HRG_05126 [Hirsutella rhossiliensis]KAH0964698.1 hypothetical protein HRG_05126 [Hirsutella rhossiliensis]